MDWSHLCKKVLPNRFFSLLPSSVSMTSLFLDIFEIEVSMESVEKFNCLKVGIVVASFVQKQQH